MKILVTGSAGFIGFSVALALLKLDHEVVGIDNHNDYYDVELKNARCDQLLKYTNYSHIRIDIADVDSVEMVFNQTRFDRVVHLAAQAGVRYSLQNPHSYAQSNLVGFTNILECCRRHSVAHLVYASSSSVYGANSSQPLSIHDSANHPLSFYAATKKANELMAHSYSHLYHLPTTGLRFFTVYGPWGRPDMALFKFTKAILSNENIDVYNYGRLTRDFTYIDDIVGGVLKALSQIAKPNVSWDAMHPDPGTSLAPWRLYNLGNNRPINIGDYIKALELALGQSAQLNYTDMQSGDVINTWADITDTSEDLDYAPKTSVEDGIAAFVKWFRAYYNI